MSYIQGKDRHQITMSCLDDMVDSEHIVRIVDSFLSAIDLTELGFAPDKATCAGRPSYDPKDLIALYIYGSLNAVRSSRRLAKLATESLPAIWLLQGLAPDFRTIADFRKNNRSAFDALFDEFGSFLEFAGLFGKVLCAIDGTTIRASNNKKRNFSKKGLEKRNEALSERLKDYLSQMDEADDLEEALEASDRVESCKGTLRRTKERIEALEASGEDELSVTDKDARMMCVKTGGVGVCYNVQASVDAQENLVVAYDVINQPADSAQLYSMADASAEALRKRQGLSQLADKGYYGAGQLRACEADALEVTVAPQLARGDKDRPAHLRLSAFEYDCEKDCYVCPMGDILTTTNSPEAKQRSFSNAAACSVCRHAKDCVKGKATYRVIYRGKDADVLDRARRNFEDNKELYQLRQQTVEPVFGTIKASMGFTSFLLRGLDKVRAEAALVFLGYNIKRSLGALGFQQMIEALGHYGAWLARTGAKRAGAAASSTSACPVQTLQGRRVAFLRPYGQKTRHLRAA
jgi:transposase